MSGFIKKDKTGPVLVYKVGSPFLVTEFTTRELIESAGEPIAFSFSSSFLFVPAMTKITSY